MNNRIIGHTERLHSLQEAYQQNRLHPGLLFSGPEGIGKKLVAEALAQSILCESEDAHVQPCGTCGACRLVISKNHPDLFAFDPSTKEEGTVEALRGLMQKLSMSSFRGRAKVVIINHADSFSVAAANIFLKTLEEPRPNIFFIMIATNSSRLPITIRSRSQRWEFQPLTPLELREVVKNSLTIPIENDALFDLADGSVTQLLRLADQSDQVTELQAFVKECVIKNKITESLIFIQGLAKDKEHLEHKLTLLIALLRAEMRTQASLISDSAVDGAGTVSRLSCLVSDTIAAQRLIFERNVNPLILLTDVVKRVLVGDVHITQTSMMIGLPELVRGY